MYLQMTMDGRVSGSDVQTPYSEYLALKYAQILILHDSLDHSEPKRMQSLERIVLFFFFFKGTFSLSVYAFRCAGAEICQSRPRGLEGEVVIPVPLCGQRGPPERTGTVNTDVPDPKSLDLHV